jgi:hypothetical protein
MKPEEKVNVGVALRTLGAILMMPVLYLAFVPFSATDYYEIDCGSFFFRSPDSYEYSGCGSSFTTRLVLIMLLSGLSVLCSAIGVALHKSGKSEIKDEQTETSSGVRQCPYCAEKIKLAAIKCKHCGSEIPPATVNTQQGDTQSPAGSGPSSAGRNPATPTNTSAARSQASQTPAIETSELLEKLNIEFAEGRISALEYTDRKLRILKGMP